MARSSTPSQPTEFRTSKLTQKLSFRVSEQLALQNNLPWLLHALFRDEGVVYMVINCVCFNTVFAWVFDYFHEFIEK